MTTLNLQVGADVDDGARYSGNQGFVFDNGGDALGYYDSSGEADSAAFLRWTGVSIEGTIDGAHIQLFSYLQLGSAQLRVYGVDEDNPATPTSAGEFDADPLTTASVDWDGAWNDEAWNTSPELKTIFQELIDSYTISGDALMVQVKNDGPTTTNANFWETYDNLPTPRPPKLDIDYSAGAGFVEGQVSLSGVGSMAAAASLTLPAEVAMSGVGTMVVAGTKGTTKTGAVALSGVGTMSGAGVIIAGGKAIMNGVGSMAVVGERIVPGAVVMSGVGSMSAIGEVAGLLEGRADISGVGTMTVVAERIAGGSASFSGVGSMSVEAVVTLVGQASLSGVGSMVVIGETGDVLYTIFGGVFRWIDPADYPDGAQFFFEVTLSASAGGTARARLFNLTLAAVVADSEIATSRLFPFPQRSSALTLASGPNLYRVEYGGALGGTYTIYAADLLVESD